MIPYLLFAVLFLQQPETLSMLEQPLYAPSFSHDVREKLETDLASARAAFQKDPKNADAAIALVHADMAIGHVGDALELLSRTIEAHGDDNRLFLERARALIVYRKFEPAARDARRVADGIPEASCTLGLALYLNGEFAPARDAYAKCSDPGVFKYLADRRAGGSSVPRPDVSSAPDGTVTPPIVLPGTVKHSSDKSAGSMASSYVDAAEKIAAHKPRDAEPPLKKIVEKDQNRWMDPVYIAAEADYARILKAAGRFKKPGRKN
jgi:tetratricopeptide (TPR) repeat protein